MEILKDTSLLSFPPNLLETVRKQYDMDKPGVMDEAIDILELWIKKQDHFTVKSFDRDYLERFIIRAKGSVERTKERLDKTCTARTLIPSLFTNWKINEFQIDTIEEAIMPKLTQDNYRVYVARNRTKEASPGFYTHYFQRMIYYLEYLCANDYSEGIMVVVDFIETDIMDCIKNLNVSDFAHMMTIFINSFGFRLKSLTFITSSKVIDVLINIFKQVTSAKIGSRITSAKSIDNLFNEVDREVLPEDYGGKEKPLAELNALWFEVISSNEHINYVSKMYEAKTNEALRSSDQPSEGIAGTFRNLRVD